MNLAQLARAIAAEHDADIGIIILAKRGGYIPFTEIRFGRSSDLQDLELQAILRGVEVRLGRLKPPVIEETINAEGETNGV